MKYTFLAFLMVFCCWVDAALKPADGMWRSTDDPDIGSGLMLVTQGGITLVSVFTYTETGSPKWFLAVGSVDENGLFQAELKETINGTSMLESNPESAEYSAVSRNIEIQFFGTQIGSFSINGLPVKTMQANHFGYPVWETEHQTLLDGTDYMVADVAGTWVFAGIESEESFILDLVETDSNTNSTAPFTEKTYQSSHPSTTGWTLNCPWQFIPTTLPFSQPYCVLKRNDANLSDLRVPYEFLGNSKMSIISGNGDKAYTGFRTNMSNELSPNDGHWRTEDDPEIGSGLVLTTQGGVTVVLMYSYDDSGAATWKIASGVFDESGLLATDLLTTQGGSPIESEGKTTATFTDQSQTIEIQLLGSELATFSVDESETKFIQNYNFGVELFNTDHLKINDQPFAYPDQSGQWVVVDDENKVSGVIKPVFFNFNLNISPPIPSLYNARTYYDEYDGLGGKMEFYCRNGLTYSNLTFEAEPYCTGFLSFADTNQNADLKIYFEDIGYNEFKFYVDDGDLGFIYDDIDRNSKFYQLFRLDD